MVKKRVLGILGVMIVPAGFALSAEAGSITVGGFTWNTADLVTTAVVITETDNKIFEFISQWSPAGWVASDNTVGDLNDFKDENGNPATTMTNSSVNVGDNTAQNEIELTWGGNLLGNGAGDDLVVYENAGSFSAPEAFAVAVRKERCSTFSAYRYEKADAFDGNGVLVTSTGFDLSSFGLLAGEKIDAIRIRNLIGADTVDGSDGQGNVIFGGGSGYPPLRPDGTAFPQGSLDPDITVVAGLYPISSPVPANKLAFTTQPSNGTAGTALATQPVVTVQDACNNTVTTATNSITLAIGTNPPGSGVLQVTTNPLAATAGVATFSGVRIDQAGTGYTLTASATGLTGATSAAFNIVARSPADTVALSQSQDPAQLGTAKVLPVKVASSTDTILVLYRQSTDAAPSTGTTGDIRLTFYTTACATGTSVTVNLTEPDLDLGDSSEPWVSNLFNTTASGVILGKPLYDADVRWQMIALVVDGDLGATYERRGLPALVKQNLASTVASAASDSVWAGFSSADFMGYYIQGAGFTTTLQFVCPPSGTALATAMEAIASLGTLSSDPEMDVIRVYDDGQTLLGTLTNVDCRCFTENPSGVQALMALNANYIGTIYIDVNSPAVGWRVIVLTTTAGNLWIDGRIARVAGTAS